MIALTCSVKDISAGYKSEQKCIAIDLVLSVVKINLTGVCGEWDNFQLSGRDSWNGDVPFVTHLSYTHYIILVWN